MNIAKSCSKSGPCPTYCMHAHFRIHVASVPSIRIKTGNPSFTNLFGFRISFGLVKKVNENGGGSCTTTSRTPPSLHRRSMSRNILGEETSSPMFSVNSARPVVQLSPWAVLPFHTPVSARLWMRWRLTVDFGCQLIVWQLRIVMLIYPAVKQRFLFGKEAEEPNHMSQQDVCKYDVHFFYVTTFHRLQSNPALHTPCYTYFRFT